MKTYFFHQAFLVEMGFHIHYNIALAKEKSLKDELKIYNDDD